MTQTANIINFERPVVKADIENGFTRVANELTDALMRNEVGLSGREFQLVHAIISKTYRYHKAMDWISSSQLSELTGIDVTNVGKVKSSLFKKNVLIKDGQKIGINTTVSSWIRLEKSQKRLAKNKSNSTREKSNPTSDQSNSTRTPVESDPHNKKDNNTKDYYTKDNASVAALPKKSPPKKSKLDAQSEVLNLALPECLSFDLWAELVAHRKEIKKPFTVRAANMQLKSLAAWHAKGHDIEAIIQNSISNGYQGLFEPKGNPQGRTFQSHQERIREENMRVMSNWANKE